MQLLAMVKSINLGKILISKPLPENFAQTFGHFRSALGRRDARAEKGFPDMIKGR